MSENQDTAGGGGRTVGGRLVGLVATLAGNSYLLVGTIVFSALSMLVALVPPRGHWVNYTARAWAGCLLWSGGARVVTRFAVSLPTDRSYVFMSNHQSLFDIPALLVGLPGQTRFLAKRALFRIPLFGWALKMGGFISIDRRNRSRAGDSFAEAIRELEVGASAVVFPEGTRSDDGRLLPFQRGGFLLALKSGLPIVPVGIHGSREVRAKSSFWIQPGRITVSCGRPLATGDYGVRDKARLMEDVRRRVAALSSG